MSNIISGVNSPVNEMVSRIDVDKMVSYDQRNGNQNTIDDQIPMNGMNKRSLKIEQKQNQMYQ